MVPGLYKEIYYLLTKSQLFEFLLLGLHSCRQNVYFFMDDLASAVCVHGALKVESCTWVSVSSLSSSMNSHLVSVSLQATRSRRGLLVCVMSPFIPPNTFLCFAIIFNILM